MVSIPSKKLCEDATAAAVESRRPWRVKDLREKALEACRTAGDHASSSGLSREQTSELVGRCIYGQVLKAGRGMDALPPGQNKPTPGQIRAALSAFSVEQWIGLLGSMDRTGTEALLSHVRRHAGELKERLGARKVEVIEARAIMRETALWLGENRDKLVPVSDVYWAIVLPDLADEANLARATNREGSGRPAKGGSVAELGSYRSIARRLSKHDERTGREMKVSRDQVKEWRERAKRSPYEEYAADKTADEVRTGAALLEYWAMIRTKYQRRK